MSKKISEWSEKYDTLDIKHFTFEGLTAIINDKGETKKQTEGFPLWRKITKENYKNYVKTYHRGMAVITGEISGITGLDFDDETLYHKFIMDFPELKNFYTVKTNKGYHIYIKYVKELKQTTALIEGLDIRNDGGILYAPPTMYKLPDGTIAKYDYIGGDILPLPESILNKLIVNKEEKVEKKQKVIKVKPLEEVKTDTEDDLTVSTSSEKEINMNDYAKMEKIINDGFLDKEASSYPSWFEVGCVFKNEFGNEKGWEIFNLFSKRNVAKYNERENKTIFDDNIKSSHQKPIKIGSLIQKLRRRNPDFEIMKIVKEKEDTDTTDENNEETNEETKKVRKERKPKMDEAETSNLKKSLHDKFLKMCGEFEKEHVKIVNMAVYVKELDEQVLIFTKAKLKDAYEHLTYYKLNSFGIVVPDKFVTGWTECNDKIRKKDDIGVYPNKELCPENIFNMWRPFAMDLKKGGYVPDEDGKNKLLNHIKILCDNDEGVYNYFISWISQMIQYPEIKTVIITLISKQGAGKGTLIKLLTLLLGINKVLETTKPSRDVWGDFNGIMANCFLVNLNELNKKDTIDNIEQIKGLITDASLTINNKGVNQFKIVSYHRFIITTNNENPIDTKSDDRRNVIIRSSDEKIGDKAYFTEINELMGNDNVLRTLWDYFKNFKTKDGKDMANFGSIPLPQTEHQTVLQNANRTKPDLWLESFTEDNQNKKGEIKLKPADVLVLFNKWCDNEGIKFDTDSLKLGVNLSQLKIPNDAISSDAKRRYKFFNIEELKKHYGIGCPFTIEK